MTRHIGFFALAALIAGSLAADAADYKNIQIQKDEKDVLQLESQWTKALLSRDTAALERILAPDYTMVDPAGKAFTKAQEIATYSSGDLKFDSLQASDKKVRIYQGGAVVTGKIAVKGKYKDEDISGDYLFVDVYEAKRSGGWHVAYSQLTAVETEKDKKKKEKEQKSAEQ